MAFCQVTIVLLSMPDRSPWLTKYTTIHAHRTPLTWMANPHSHAGLIRGPCNNHDYGTYSRARAGCGPLSQSSTLAAFDLYLLLCRTSACQHCHSAVRAQWTAGRMHFAYQALAPFSTSSSSLPCAACACVAVASGMAAGWRKALKVVPCTAGRQLLTGSSNMASLD